MTKISITNSEAAAQAIIEGRIELLAEFLETYGNDPEVSSNIKYAGGASKSVKENAQQIIADWHHFNSWAEYEKFQNALKTNTRVRQFEQAADAIAFGDADTLKTLLTHDPALIATRSLRNHHCTLLNYVGANGFENWRQKTPMNSVEIANILLDAGAEVDARGDMYHGTTTLGLIATSAYPVIAGVQQELLEILITYGADPNNAVAAEYTDGLLIVACLHNGRGEPIHYLAAKGAEIDLEGAGGLGDLERVKTYFTTNGDLDDIKMEIKRDACLIWASIYGHSAIVEFLLEHGCSVNTIWDNTTPLHSAAYGGQAALVRLLLDNGAPIEVLNKHGDTVLGTTLWAMNKNRKPGHLEIMEMLVASGADIKSGWQTCIDEQRNRLKQ